MNTRDQILELKRRIAVGDVSVADVILSSPEEAESWSVSELLMSQRRWGSERCRKFLKRNDIYELKSIGSLTNRQRAPEQSHRAFNVPIIPQDNCHIVHREHEARML